MEKNNNNIKSFFDQKILKRNQTNLKFNFSGSVYPTNSDFFLSCKFEILKEEKNKNIFEKNIQNFSKEDLIEQPLQIFSCLSYLISDDSNLERFIHDEFDNINNFIISINNEFLKSKVCNFYSFNLDEMYHDSETALSKSFDDSINFLFNCLLNEEQNLNLNFTALESIDPLIFEDTMINVSKDFIRIYSKNIFSMLNIKKFNTITETLKFKGFISNLIMYYTDEISHCASSLFDYLWENFKKTFEFYLQEKAQIMLINNNKNLNGSYIDMNNAKFSYRSLIKDLNKKDEVQIETSAFNTILEILEKIKTRLSKINIYEKILILLNKMGHLLDYKYEEEIFDLLKFVINDLKLIPEKDNYNLSLFNLIYALEPKVQNLKEFKDLKNLNFEFEKIYDLNKLENFDEYKNENKIQTYHINFIFVFLKNTKFEDCAVVLYKNDIFKMVLINFCKEIFILKSLENLSNTQNKYLIEKINKTSLGLYIKFLYCYLIVNLLILIDFKFLFSYINYFSSIGKLWKKKMK